MIPPVLSENLLGLGANLIAVDHDLQVRLYLSEKCDGRLKALAIAKERHRLTDDAPGHKEGTSSRFRDNFPGSLVVCIAGIETGVEK